MLLTSRESGSTSVHTRRRMTSMARRPATAAHSFQGTTCACKIGKRERENDKELISVTVDGTERSLL